MTIHDLFIKYSSKIDHLDLELLIAHAIKKPREFVLAHPEARVAPKQELRIKNYANRRRRGEPLAYILGHKEFYGLDFTVDKNTLIPRPETELLVELAAQELRTTNKDLCIVDVGTGSGNIIISLAKLLESRIMHKELGFFGIDISSGSLKIAKQNAKNHGVDKKINPAPSCKSLNLLKNIHSHHSQQTITPPRRCGIKFLRGNLLDPLLKNNRHILPNTKYLILANLPYLSPALYKSTPVDVKKFEPKTALLSENHGLAHYEKLLKQIKILNTKYNIQHTAFLEISPEQKPRLAKIIKKYLPAATIKFHQDLAGKWRVCQIAA